MQCEWAFAYISLTSLLIMQDHVLFWYAWKRIAHSNFVPLDNYIRVVGEVVWNILRTSSAPSVYVLIDCVLSEVYSFEISYS